VDDTNATEKNNTAMATSSQPTNLFEYYQSIGEELPSRAARAKLYYAQNLGPEGEYKGTAEQNTRLLGVLLKQAEPDPPSPVEAAESHRSQNKGTQSREDLGLFRENGYSNADIAKLFVRDVNLGTSKAFIEAPGDVERVASYPSSMNVYDALVDWARSRIDALNLSPTGIDLPPQAAWGTGKDPSYPSAVASPLIDVNPVSGGWSVRGVDLNEVARMAKDAASLIINDGREALVEAAQRGIVSELLAAVKQRVPLPLFSSLMRIDSSYQSVKSIKDLAVEKVRPIVNNLLAGMDEIVDGTPGFDPSDRGLKDLQNGVEEEALSRTGIFGGLFSKALGNTRIIIERSEAREQPEQAPDEFAVASVSNAKLTYRFLVQDTEAAAGLTVASGKRVAVLGAANGDTLTGGALGDLLQGQDGSDSFSGGGGPDLLLGGGGNDRLVGGDGGDTLYGGPGDDRLIGANTTLALNQAADVADLLDGGAGNDTLWGNAGNDTLLGGEGNDVLRGDSGNDSIDGGPGIDRASYRFDEVTVLPGGVLAPIRFDASAVGAATIVRQADGLGGIDTLIGVEAVAFTGNAMGDSFIGSGGPDSAFGGAGGDSLSGGDGNDTLDGGTGNDTLDGGEGLDVALFDYSDSTLVFSAGSGAVFDFVAVGGTGDVRISAPLLGQDVLRGIEAVSVIGSARPDRFTGSRNDDSMFGAEGNDTLDGGAGNDTLLGGGSWDVIIGGDGDDMLTGGSGNDTLIGGAGNDSASFSGALADYTIAYNSTTASLTITDSDTLAGRDGVDVVSSVERFVFADGTVSLADLLPGNKAPMASDIALRISEDQLVWRYLPEASDRDGDAVTYASVSAPSHGTLLIEPTGSYRYVPTLDYSGSDAFGYSVSDGKGGVRSYTATVTIDAVNDAPRATRPIVDQLARTTRPFTLTLPADAMFDVEGAPVTYSASLASGQALPAWLRFDAATRSFSGTPGASEAAELQVRLSGSDGVAIGSTTFKLRVELFINVSPVAAATSVVASEDTVLRGSLPAARDADGDPVGYEVAAAPARGTLTVSANGSFVYTPTPDFFGNDRFSYSVFDDQGGRNTYAVQVQVLGVNDAPRGTVTVSGTPVLGERLAAQVNLSDSEGLGRLSYQWLRGGVAIGGATTSTYVSNVLDLGQRLSVRVNYVDGGGSSESVVSSNSVAIAAPTSIEGTPAADSLIGSSGADSLMGFGGNDTLEGGAGNDTLDGGDGADVLRGGEGFDTATFSVISVAVLADLAQGFAQVGGVRDSLSSIEALFGGKAGDRLRGDAGANLLDGFGGADWLEGLDGADTLLGSDDADTLDGGLGIDWADFSGLAQGLGISLDAGTAVSQRATTSLIAIENVRGTPQGDEINGSALANVLEGGGGDDRLIGGGGNDRLAGGEGNDTLDGGDGFDVADYRGHLAVSVRLETGLALQADDSDLLMGIEAVFGSNGDDQLIGRAGDPTRPGETFRGNGGQDTLDGRTGIDRAEYNGPRSAFTITRDRTQELALSVTHTGASGNAGDGNDVLRDIEMLIFSDRALAFGARAEQVARVAVVLWTPAIVTSRDLFAKGLSYYENGYSFEQLCSTALNYWTSLSDRQLATTLLQNSNSSAFTSDQLLAVMAQNGGGNAGRAQAVKVIAEDAATTQKLQLAGVFDNGLEASLVVDGVALFGLLPG
jgi:Ca2+-binding RTX toxin-like protein